MIKEIFRIDKKFWTQSQSDEVEVFFRSNPFFSKFYDCKNFNHILAMTFYTRLYKNNPLFLENNKKPQAIIVLSGKIDIYKKFYKDKSKKTKTKKTDPILINQNQVEQTYEFYKTLLHENQTTNVGSECKLVSGNECDSELLFVPWIMYNQHVSVLKSQKSEVIFKGLKKKALMSLAEEGCYLKEFNFNNIIYRAGSIPFDVYLLIQGNIKLQKPITGSKKIADMVIVEPPLMFGQKDIKLLHRQQSAIVNSAFAKVIIISKKEFLKFAREFLPDLNFFKEEQKQLLLPILSKKRNSLYQFDEKKENIMKFSSSLKFEQEKNIQNKIINNCHLLANLSPKKSKTERFDAKRNDFKDYTKDQFQEKIKLFNKIRPDVRNVGFENPIINLVSKKHKIHRNQSFDQ